MLGWVTVSLYLHSIECWVSLDRYVSKFVGCVGCVNVSDLSEDTLAELFDYCPLSANISCTPCN